MADFLSTLKANASLSDDAQKAAGKAVSGAMDPKHQEFLDLLLKLLEEKKIVANEYRSFLNEEVYNKLQPSDQDKIDVDLMNIGQELERIIAFRLSKETPDSSPQLQTMIDSLWQMKSRTEDKVGDVFKF